ncbi:MAG TPA: FtsX-like permease family protein [Spirochaetia bacterium]|nr:FtsX-like permease family protein [Spirochaetia bacterium]
MELFLLGYRNVARNFRRTILNVIAIAVGVAVLLFGQGWIRGYYNTIYTGVRNFETGDVQVLEKGYLDEQRRLPLDIAIGNYAELAAKIKTDPAVAAVAPRIEFSATVGTPAGSVRVLGRAIDPANEAKVTVTRQFMQQGHYLTSGSGGVLIGAPLAAKLGVKAGDTISVTAVDRYSAENYIQAVVEGVFRFGYPPVDENTLFIDLPTAQELLGMKGEATRLVVKLAPGVGETAGLQSVRKVLADAGQVRAYSWREFAQAVVIATSGDIGSFKIIMVIMYLLIVIGILNSMSMSVQERIREIGTLRAIGMKRGRLTSLFLSESVWIAIFGAIIGCVLGGVVVYYMEVVGFDFSKFSSTSLPIPWGHKFTGDYRPVDFLVATAVGIVTAIAGGFLPALRATKLNIAWSLGAHIN